MSTNNREGAKLLLSKVMPFEEWKVRRNPTKAEIEWYHKIVDTLKEMSVMKNEREFYC